MLSRQEGKSSSSTLPNLFCVHQSPVPFQKEQSRVHPQKSMHLLHIAVTIQSELWGSGVDLECRDTSNLLVKWCCYTCRMIFMRSVSMNQPDLKHLISLVLCFPPSISYPTTETRLHNTVQCFCF